MAKATYRAYQAMGGGKRDSRHDREVSFERTPDAYARMFANEARFGMVIEMAPDPGFA